MLPHFLFQNPLCTATISVSISRTGPSSRMAFCPAAMTLKEDLDVLAEALPSQIDAIFLCHGIALKADASNALEVQKVNFLGHKYLLEKILPRIADNGSVNIIASTGGFGWQGVFADCAAVVNAPSYEAALDWYETHPDVIRSGYVFSKQCLCAYVKMKVHAPEYISRRILTGTPRRTVTRQKEKLSLKKSS